MSGNGGNSGNKAAAKRENITFASVATPDPAVATVATPAGPVATVATWENPVATPDAAIKPQRKQRVSEAVATVSTVATENEHTGDFSSDAAAIEERAAIMEYGAGMPRAWADAFAAIMVGPSRFPDDPRRWQSVADGALIFADQWAGKAHALGWTVDELFGLDPIAPAARVDRRGLAFLLGDASRVVAIDMNGADIVTAQGSRQRFYRRQRIAA